MEETFVRGWNYFADNRKIKYKIVLPDNVTWDDYLEKDTALSVSTGSLQDVFVGDFRSQLFVLAMGKSGEVIKALPENLRITSSSQPEKYLDGQAAQRCQIEG